jgi:superfamily II RNA helicase
MNGKPQILTSKFKISYNLLLNLLDIGDKKLVQFANKSMVTGDLDNQMKEIYHKITSLNGEIDNIKLCVSNLRTPVSVLEEFIELQTNRVNAVNKKRKEIERKLQNIYDNYKYIEQDKLTYLKIDSKENELNELQKEYDSVNSYIKSGVGTVLTLLKEEGFIEGNPDDELSLNLTLKGKIASQLREVHCLVFAKLLEDKKIDHLSSRQLVSLFSIFTNITVQEDFKQFNPDSNDDDVQINVNLLTILYNKYKDKEIKNNINTGFEYNIQYDLLNYIDEWCVAESIEECKLVLQKIGEEKQIFLGEFVKALLKINNISAEFEKIAELTGNMALLSTLREIPNITLKYVVTNQSLYV